MSMKQIVEHANDLKAAGNQLAEQIDGCAAILTPLQCDFLRFFASFVTATADKAVEISAALIHPEGNA